MPSSGKKGRNRTFSPCNLLLKNRIDACITTEGKNWVVRQQLNYGSDNRGDISQEK